MVSGKVEVVHPFIGMFAPGIYVIERILLTDYLSTENSILLYTALKKAGISVEMHIYARGGHGFGMRPSPNHPGPVASKWPELWVDWMEDSGFLSD